jgi:3-hydroxyisobutyrate dehydrogenase
MLKDLKLAQQAAQASGAATPMGAEAAALFQLLVGNGLGAKDFSVMFKFLMGQRAG